MNRKNIAIGLTHAAVEFKEFADRRLRGGGQLFVGGQPSIKLFRLNVDAAAQGFGSKRNQQRYALDAVFFEHCLGQIDGAICDNPQSTLSGCKMYPFYPIPL